MDPRTGSTDLASLCDYWDAVVQLPSDQLPAALTALGGFALKLAARLASDSATRMPAPAAEERLLNVREAAAKLGISTSRLYREANHMPFTLREGRSLRFSALGIDKYIRQRQRGM